MDNSEYEREVRHNREMSKKIDDYLMYGKYAELGKCKHINEIKIRKGETNGS